MSGYKLYLKEIISMIEKIENSVIGKTLEDTKNALFISFFF